ncbi:MAG: hypothetical protein MRY32_05265 [Rickettsiales bacterium]|nr:hypothetical protein [Rickettsiales bacterium]
MKSAQLTHNLFANQLNTNTIPSRKSTAEASVQTSFSALLAEQDVPAQDKRAAIIEANNKTVLAGKEIIEDPKEVFMDFMNKTPAERMRAIILKEMGLTEESLAAKSAEDRKKIEDKIAQTIKERIEEATVREIEEMQERASVNEQAVTAEADLQGNAPDLQTQTGVHQFREEDDMDRS